MLALVPVPVDTAPQGVPRASAPQPPGTTESTLVLAQSTAPCTRLQSGIRKPKLYTDETIHYGNLSICEKSSDFATAITDPNWKAAMESEFSAFSQNKTLALSSSSSRQKSN